MNRSLTCLTATLFAAAALPVAAENTDRALELFENKIRPALVEHCYACHSQADGAVEGELSLENHAAAERGGRGGAVIVPGDPDNSRLLQAIEHRNADLQMPPSGKLPDETIAAFREWIRLGAADPRDGAAPEIDTIDSRAARHWAFQPPQAAELPSPRPRWARTDLDALVLAELSSAGFAPATEASRREQVQRLYYDLSGLAPTAEQIKQFENAGHDAYDKLVDELLASQRFGERWARHWLDVARFADTKGYVFTEDRTFPNAYKYRDWVIAAFNADLPIDRFLRLQIAADQIDQEQLAAQGFVTLGRRFINNPHDIAADRIDVVFRGMMGLTVACARCHDHKYDPVSAEDYYALYGVFASSAEQQDGELPLRLVDKPQPENVGVFIRGAAHNRGEIAERGFPDFFSDFAPAVTTGSGRLELADAVADERNPLTARVFVNRVWGHLFGEQLVRTPSDFGLRCDAPRQQAVLDHLAVRFMEHDWSLKWLVRELVTSSTYRQSSHADAALLAADAENVLWGRTNRRRLDFESMRDRLLAAAELLDTGTVGGPSEEISTDDGGRRRTLYAHIDRQNLPGLFRTFDFASPDAHSPERPHTMVPQQALFLLNSPMVQRAALAISVDLSELPSEDQVTAAYRRVLGREPREEELMLATEFLGRPAPSPLPPGDWAFGYGAVQGAAENPAISFAPLSHFTENRWQAASQFPAPEIGHLCVTPTGGHPGNSSDYSAIRRWTAPARGDLTVDGQLERPEKRGDGVDGLLISSRRGVVGKWTTMTGASPTHAHVEDVEPGESFDLVVSCRAEPSYDTFSWQTKLTLETKTSRRVWKSEEGFTGPVAAPLELLPQLVQVLLVSNEFLYID
ncbi:Planctomycete cytochrome C [Posidoniimonas polymericola]|uniref:Planctomycete cytochrome C n=1 Tax=Posidoniimonas polymericola TaxID=2528002 RepID=A0A5C5YUG2_9BACT|nr:PSD1 and planctomycete cytochrome C domain-containing protein [Posidoniimonas polymericola]TWT78303.1 Planctomycete cytochrome C [Posidoniimonas polymericola]